MRLFWMAVVATFLVASIGFAYLRERPGQSAAAQDGVTTVASAAVGDEADGETAEPAKSVFYQWVDERGTVNFAASLDEVPVAWRQRAGQVEFDAGAFVQARGSSLRVTPSRRPQTVPDTAPIPVREVTVYTAPWCGWCRKTLAFLDERGVDYVNKDIEADEDYAAELRDKTGGSAIPFVEIDGSQIHGFDPGKMAALLD